GWRARGARARADGRRRRRFEGRRGARREPSSPLQANGAPRHRARTPAEAVMREIAIGVFCALVAAVVAVGGDRRRALRSAPHMGASGAGVPLQGGESIVGLPTEILRAVIDSGPTALVVYRDAGAIVYASQAARDLFFEGRQAEG